jgi:hypothetical protein
MLTESVAKFESTRHFHPAYRLPEVRKITYHSFIEGQPGWGFAEHYKKAGHQYHRTCDFKNLSLSYPFQFYPAMIVALRINWNMAVFPYPLQTF